MKEKLRRFPNEHPIVYNFCLGATICVIGIVAGARFRRKIDLNWVTKHCRSFCECEAEDVIEAIQDGFKENLIENGDTIVTFVFKEKK